MIDPVTLEIQWQRLVTIADEMDNATIRASFSTIVGESHDFGCIVMDGTGLALAQAQLSPPDFCTMMPITVGHLLRRFPRETLRAGDVLVTNDPWMGSTHLPDYNVITPVFRGGQVVAFFGTVAHVSDVGGHLGDLEAYDVFMEGLRVPPALLYKAGQPNTELIEIIAANCRVPEHVLGDLRAIVGTHRMATSQLLEFMDDYGLAELTGLSLAIRGRSEAALRRAIAALPDGISYGEVQADGYAGTVKICVRVEVRGDELWIDYAGTSPQRDDAAINVAFNMTYSSSIYPIKCMLVPHVPNNDGIKGPLHITAPEGSVLNCTFPAPVKARAKIAKHIPPALFVALAPLLPDQAIAGAGGIFPFHVHGDEPPYGRFAVHVLPHGGMGALHGMDGNPPVAYPDNSTVTPIEIMELRAPVRMLHKKLIPDSGGAGTWRGGSGVEYVFQCVARKPITLTIRPDQMLHPAPGLFGGMPGAPGAVFINGEQIQRFVPFVFRPGDICVLHVPGGGGYGPPQARHPDRVRADVAAGIVSAEAAAMLYGVRIG